MKVLRFAWPLAALLPCAAAAQTLALGWDEVGYDAVEKTPGGFVLNRDHGTLRGPTLRAGAEAAGLRLGVDASQWRGTPGYEGFTQFGLPLATGTQLRWRRAGLSVEPAEAWAAAGLQWRPGLALATQQIRRAILASTISSATTETLHRQSAAATLALERRFGALTFGAGAWAAWPLRQRLDVDTFGVLDRYDLEPEKGRSGALSLSMGAAFAPGWSISVHAAREVHEFGASAAVLVTRGGQPAAVSAYPGSVQRVTRAGVELRLDLR